MIDMLFASSRWHCGRLAPLIAMALAGCPASEPTPTVDQRTGTEPGSCTAGGPQVVHFTTDDGLVLEADLYPTGITGRPAAILLHEVPPFNTRANYPRAF